MEARLISLIVAYYAIINGIEPSLAMKMAKVESNMNPNAISKTEDGGLFQLNRKAHKFHHEQWRYSPITNTAIAMNVLGKLRLSCKHKLRNAYVLCYNRGKAGAAKVKSPFNDPYYLKVVQ